jgi:hypothetical protein
MIRAAIILGVLAILAAALAGGRYSLIQQGNMAFEVDRYMEQFGSAARDFDVRWVRPCEDTS